MASTSVRIEGLTELKRAFGGLKKSARGRILRASVGAGARVVRDEAASRAPQDTGKLKANIIATRRRASESHDEEWAVTVRTKGKGDDPKNAFYWKFLEFGTAKLAARPFLTPAFEAAKQSALQAIVSRFSKRLDAEVRKLARGAR